MSYFDDQMDAWFENNCQGKIEDYTPFLRGKETAADEPCNPSTAKTQKPKTRIESPRVSNRLAANATRYKA